MLTRGHDSHWRIPPMSCLSGIRKSGLSRFEDWRLCARSIELALFRVRDLKLFCDQYSSIVPTFNYLCYSSINFSTRLLLTNTSKSFGIYLEIPNIFRKTFNFSCWGLNFFAIGTVPFYRFLTILKWLELT